MHELALVVPLLAGEDVLLSDAALATVDSALVTVDSEDRGGLEAAHLDEAPDGVNAVAGKLGEWDHALDIVIPQGDT